MTTKQAETQARYRVRKRLTDAAVFAGVEPLDVAFVGIKPKTGAIVLIGYDGKRIPLVLDHDFDSSLSDPPTRVATVTPIKRVYAPKSWVPSTWNSNRQQFIDAGLTRLQAIAELKRAFGEHPETENGARKLKHAIAVIEALPDTPDWATALPIAEETES